MLSRITLLALFLIMQVPLFSQNFIKGIVKDADTKEPLAFATIQYAMSEGIITNENGEFTIPWESRITTLRVSYVGYQTKDFPVSRTEDRIVIFLKNASTSISEIVVTATDLFASNLLFQSIKKSRKDARKKRTSKLFRRTYSYRNKEPTELMEAFYNVDMRDGGIDFFHLKNGRFGIPDDNYLINIQITDLFTVHKLFTREFNTLPESPLNYKSLKKLRKDFDIRIRKKYAIEKDTIYEIDFSPIQKQDILFEGKAWVKQSNYKIEKVTLEIKNTSRNPFYTIIDPDKNKVNKFDLKLNIGFKYIKNKTVFDYIQMEESKTIQSIGASSLLETNTKFYFYDYDKPFQLPFFSQFADGYHDYEKVLFFPYDEVFWNRNYLIEETAEETKFRSSLEEKQLFESRSSRQTELIRKRYEPWTKNWKLSPNLVSERLVKKGDGLDHAVYVKFDKDNINPKNNLNAYTFISLDYECYSDTVIFKTDAIIDYRYTYSLYRLDLEYQHLENFLHLAKIHANQFQQLLDKKYATSEKCPRRNDLEKDLVAANENLKEELEKYRFKAHSKRDEKHLQELTIEIMERLEDSFE